MTLLPATRREILTALLTSPSKWWYLSDLAAHLGRTPSSLQRELSSLVECGLLDRRVEGKRVYFQPARECSMVADLQRLVMTRPGDTRSSGGRSGTRTSSPHSQSASEQTTGTRGSGERGELMSEVDAARLKSTSVSIVRKAIKSGELTVAEGAGAPRIPLDSLRAWQPSRTSASLASAAKPASAKRKSGRAALPADATWVIRKSSNGTILMIADRGTVGEVNPISTGQTVDVAAPGGIQAGLVRYVDDDIIIVELLLP